MQKISALEIEKNSALLHNALKEDIIIVTKWIKKAR